MNRWSIAAFPLVALLAVNARAVTPPSESLAPAGVSKVASAPGQLAYKVYYRELTLPGTGGPQWYNLGTVSYTYSGDNLVTSRDDIQALPIAGSTAGSVVRRVAYNWLGMPARIALTQSGTTATSTVSYSWSGLTLQRVTDTGGTGVTQTYTHSWATGSARIDISSGGNVVLQAYPDGWEVAWTDTSGNVTYDEYYTDAGRRLVLLERYHYTVPGVGDWAPTGLIASYSYTYHDDAASNASVYGWQGPIVEASGTEVEPGGGSHAAYAAFYFRQGVSRFNPFDPSDVLLLGVSAETTYAPTIAEPGRGF